MFKKFFGVFVIACAVCIGSLVTNPSTAYAEDVWAYTDGDNEVYVLTDVIRQNNRGVILVGCKEVWPNGVEHGFTVGFKGHNGEMYVSFNPKLGIGVPLSESEEGQAIYQAAVPYF